MAGKAAGVLAADHTEISKNSLISSQPIRTDPFHQQQDGTADLTYLSALWK
tara:strand:+ start:466 stop:618 length:153 start_codon:yes stop_codon:yes gene_type:complete